MTDLDLDLGQREKQALAKLYTNKWKNRGKLGENRTWGKKKKQTTNTVSTLHNGRTPSNLAERQALKHIRDLQTDQVKGGSVSGRFSGKSGIKTFVRKGEPTRNFGSIIIGKEASGKHVEEKDKTMRIAKIPGTRFILAAEGAACSDQTICRWISLRSSYPPKYHRQRPWGYAFAGHHVVESKRTHIVVPISDPCIRWSDFQLALARFQKAVQEAPEDGAILVTCSRGVNRSPALIAAYMMSAMQISEQEAIERIQAATSAIAATWLILSNMSFRRHLQTLASTLVV